VQVLLELHDGEAVSKGVNPGSSVERTDPVVAEYENADDGEFAGEGRASPVSVFSNPAVRFDWLDPTQPLTSPPHVHRVTARP
jgi:hypothetical protein